MSIPQTSEKYGIVVILDALGVKGIWKDRKPQSVLSQWEDVISTMTVDVAAAKKKGMEFSFRAFSDTLVITLTNGNVNEMLHEIAVALSSMLAVAMAFGIYFRGALSIGKFFESKMMIIGPAIDEAAMEFEQTNWIGVHVTPSVWSFIKKNPKEFIGQFVQYPVPTHGKPVNTFAVYLGNNFGEHMQKLSKTKTLIEFMHKHLEETSEPEGFEKWKNTLEFMYFYEEHVKSKL